MKKEIEIISNEISQSVKPTVADIQVHFTERMLSR
jgi:hypothetical protein